MLSNYQQVKLLTNAEICQNLDLIIIIIIIITIIIIVN